ncbi:MAG: hypothetical protein AB8H47_14665 [Bacteroidia bacterium]
MLLIGTPEGTGRLVGTISISNGSIVRKCACCTLSVALATFAFDKRIAVSVFVEKENELDDTITKAAIAIAATLIIKCFIKSE